MPVERRPRVAVTMCTYRRPDALDRALGPVVQQVRECRSAEATLVLVDNDPDAGAREMAARHPLTYVHEPRPGIAAARNAGLDAALDADAVVFVDDDEIPAPGWLDTLVDAWIDGGHDGVSGPVEYEFEVPADAWVKASGVFSRLSRPTGTRLTEAATNNLLLSTEILRRTGVRFDDRFGLTGGSDSALTRALVDAGADLRWCDEAVVREVVPASRTEAGWVTRRSRRTANAGTRLEILTADSPSRRAAVRAEYAARGVARIVRGSARGLTGLHTGDVHRVAAASIDVARGKGALTAALGRHDVEYRRTV